jgi:hypothetical protein
LKKIVEKKGKKVVRIHKVPAIKSHLNRWKLDPAEGLDLRKFILPVVVLFANNSANHIRHRIMAASVLYDSELPDQQKEGFNFLISVGKDRAYIEDVRADALDSVLRLSGPSKAQEKQQARKLLIELGREASEKEDAKVSNRVRTIYQNSQNIHDDAVSEETMNFINEIDPTIPTYTFTDIEKDLVDIYRKLHLNDIDKKRARSAIYRCSIDHATFGEDRHSVRQIFSYIWTLIQDYQEKEEVKVPGEDKKITGAKTTELLEKRFVEALVEMGDTCTTGHVARLVQVLDGYGVDMSISFKDQIIANVSGRIAAKARDVKDPKTREILDVGVMDEADPELRKGYLKWMKDSLVKLEKELWSEFKPHVKKPEFDAAFGQARDDLLGKT